MALRLNIRATGFDRVEKGLARLSGPEAEGAKRRALITISRDLQRRIRDQQLSGQVLPVVSGALRGSIDLDFGELPRAVFVGSELPQAAPLEFGWPGKNIRPRRFLERALDSMSAEDIAGAFLDEIDRSLAAAGWVAR